MPAVHPAARLAPTAAEVVSQAWDDGLSVTQRHQRWSNRLHPLAIATMAMLTVVTPVLLVVLLPGSPLLWGLLPAAVMLGLVATAAAGQLTSAWQDRLYSSTPQALAQVLARGLRGRGGAAALPVAATVLNARSGGELLTAARALGQQWLGAQRLSPAEREVADQLAAEGFTGTFGELVAVARGLV